MAERKLKIGDVVYAEGSRGLLGDVIRIDDSDGWDSVEVCWREMYSTEDAEDLHLAPETE